MINFDLITPHYYPVNGVSAMQIRCTAFKKEILWENVMFSS